MRTMTTNRQLPHSNRQTDKWTTSTHSWIFTLTHASLVSVPLTQATGSRVLRGQDVPLSRSITFKDLFAITVAINTWTASLAFRNILFHCANLSVVHILSSGTRKCKHIITLLRFLFYICAHHDILTIHIDGFDNH